MKKISLTIIFLAFIMLVHGSTNAGPYVTDIGFDGEGNLMVTKNTVVLNAFFGVIHNGEKPQTTLIRMPKYSGQKITGYRIETDDYGQRKKTPVYDDE